MAWLVAGPYQQDYEFLGRNNLKPAEFFLGQSRLYTHCPAKLLKWKDMSGI